MREKKKNANLNMVLQHKNTVRMIHHFTKGKRAQERKKF